MHLPCPLYPLRFEPYLKEVLWGGQRLPRFKGLDATDPAALYGESWEVAQLPAHCSVVAEGSLKGYRLDRLISLYGPVFMGGKVYAQYPGSFPLLIKYIDAQQDLSIQVHPDDRLAQQLHGPSAKGKTEMWYIIDAAPGASLYCGLKSPITEQEYRRRIAEGTIEEVLIRHEVKAGDVFFLPPGRIHSIGKGCLLAEIQQSSDLTYRIYDFMRKDKDGNYRELHTDYAAKAIDYSIPTSGYQLEYEIFEGRFRSPLVSCEYFSVALLSMTQGCQTVDLSFRDSFTILQCVEGEGVLRDLQGYSTNLYRGDTLLLPAQIRGFVLETQGGLKLLDTYVP
ncbi:mannose-6-phosphate isomerase [Porphyromonas crevioricanis JCM 15906]|uniref:Phosphohexomutase n=1 Tax=Porphyromonas crevioricanis JCM 15906 TaxID=1305617 RepID=S4N6M1_9PORP|nr:type I phosphomannose isomerase catalytic subunit [Porphyromonas crevioricanis]GAD04438.1 mannose-6-phosphate isomerase [Porphyromonas crevioricanis JCM 15906]SJZ76088.1 mannose-6-phosphate isomerase [Porphyromonas crevioricanis]